MPGAERKLATVLFADLVGSTSLASDQDPERTRARLERFYDAMAAEVEQAGGTIEKFAGDAVMAAFGAPAALEDHAERALHAALAMQRRLDELFGGSVALRIGVNTGEVVAAAPRAGSSFVSGDAVNVAARLEQHAEAGEILVGERTVAAAHGAFEFGDEQTIEAKGKPSGVTARPLLRALSLMRPRGFGGLDRVFVGRDTELARLQDAYRQMCEDSTPALVAVVGDAGAGKTTLVREFWQWLDDDAPLRRVGRCLAYGRALTYWPLAEILREQFGLPEDAEEDDVAEHLGDRRILGLTLGLDVAGDLHPLAARDRLQEAWIDLLEELAAERPLVVLIEDVHWAEEPLLALLDRLHDDVRGRLLLVCTARPELLERRGAWHRDALRLEPLPSDATRDLVDRLLGGVAPAWASDVVADRAEGNPFFAEELVRTLIDQRLLRRDEDGWAGEAPPELELPDSVRALVAARIDLLDEDEKAALHAAAVIGRSFWSAPVYELVGDAHPDLRKLEDRDFVRRRAGSTLAGEREYTFKHALTRDVAYESVPKALRARLHAGFAEWLESRSEGGDAHAALLAHHYAQAVNPADADLAWSEDESRLDHLRERAVEWLTRAAELAIGRYELADGRELVQRALDLAPKEPRLWRLLGEAAVLQYDGGEFSSALEQALELEPDALRQADIYAELALHNAIRAGMWRTQPDRDRAVRWVELALEQSAPGTRARGIALVAEAFWRPFDKLSAAVEACEIADRLNDRSLQAYAASARAGAELENGHFDVAAEWARRRVALGEELGDPDLIVDGYETAIAALDAHALLNEARGFASRHAELSSRLSPHHQVHAVAVRLDIEELAANWDEIAGLTDDTERTVAANVDAPCVRNVRALLLCALAAEHRGESTRARELEAAADAWGMDDFGSWGAEARLRLALVRGDLDAVAVFAAQETDARADLGPAPFAALLDAYAALGQRDRIEAALPFAQGSPYLQPFALRALGVVERDPALVGEAAARFDALGLAWHAAQTRQSL